MISTGLVREFERVRLELCRAGIPVHVPWSLSVADASALVITCASVGSAPLKFEDLVETTLHYADGRAACATQDAGLHRAMYARGRHRAVLVCRPPYAMTLAAMQPQLTVAGRAVPVIAADGLAALKRTFAGDERVVLKGQAAVVGSVDAGSCLDAMRALEDACRGALPGLSRN